MCLLKPIHVNAALFQILQTAALDVSDEEDPDLPAEIAADTVEGQLVAVCSLDSYMGCGNCRKRVETTCATCTSAAATTKAYFFLTAMLETDEVIQDVTIFTEGIVSVLGSQDLELDSTAPLTATMTRLESCLPLNVRGQLKTSNNNMVLSNIAVKRQLQE